MIISLYIIIYNFFCMLIYSNVFICGSYMPVSDHVLLYVIIYIIFTEYVHIYAYILIYDDILLYVIIYDYFRDCNCNFLAVIIKIYNKNIF